MTTKKAVDDANKLKSLKRKRTTVDSLYDTPEIQSSVLRRAKEIQANLEPEFPSLVKPMLRSHVTHGFWLGLPKNFCDKYLPKHDTTIVLEDESGEEFETKYLGGKVGLSAGWRGFSIAHKLLEGDTVVFHLVQPSKFKVYIVRSNGSDEVDGALALLNLEACMKHINWDNANKACEEKANEGLKPIYQENCQKDCPMAGGTVLGPMSDSVEVDSGSSSEGLDRIRLSESAVDFKQVRSIEDFIILVNGLVINCELPQFLLTKYYELCCSQETFLHDHLLKGLNCKLAAGIISETINIADAIRASKISTSQEDFSIWKKTLKAFELLGMKVGFLLARLRRLVNISAESNRSKGARLDRANVENKLRTLEAKLVSDKLNSVEIKLENLLELVFKEVASAPW